MDHVALDRAGAHDRDLDDEIVKFLGLEPRQHRHLRPALDLEHADRVGALDHRINARLLGRNGGKRQAPAVMAFKEIEALRLQRRAAIAGPAAHRLDGRFDEYQDERERIGPHERQRRRRLVQRAESAAWERPHVGFGGIHASAGATTAPLAAPDATMAPLRPRTRARGARSRAATSPHAASKPPTAARTGRSAPATSAPTQKTRHAPRRAVPGRARRAPRRSTLRRTDRSPAPPTSTSSSGARSATSFGPTIPAFDATASSTSPSTAVGRARRRRRRTRRTSRLAPTRSRRCRAALREAQAAPAARRNHRYRRRDRPRRRRAQGHAARPRPGVQPTLTRRSSPTWRRARARSSPG